MAPPLDKPTQQARGTDANSPEARAHATAALRALDVDDEVVFSGTADEVLAYLDAAAPGASST